MVQHLYFCRKCRLTFWGLLLLFILCTSVPVKCTSAVYQFTSSIFLADMSAKPCPSRLEFFFWRTPILSRFFFSSFFHIYHNRFRFFLVEKHNLQKIIIFMIQILFFSRKFSGLAKKKPGVLNLIFF